MPTRDDHGLDDHRLEMVEAALRADVALEAELELITSQLAEDVRQVFWRAFADGCAGEARPAAAVLGALEHAASSRRRDAP